MKRAWAVLFLLVMGLASARASSDARVVPELRLSCDPAAFSPNGDRVKDQTFIQPFLNVPDQVKKWEMVIQEAHSWKTVKKTSGYDGLPALLVWDGEDQKGHPAKEGNYVIKLSVWTENSGKLSASTNVILNLTPPIVEVNVYSPSLSPGAEGTEGSISFHTRFQDASGLDHWELSVGQEGGAPVRVWRSTGTIPDVIDWDGKDERLNVAAPAGRYLVKLTAWDLSGISGEASPAVFQVNTEAPQSLAASFKHIAMKESAAGYVVWLPATDLFIEDGLDPPLKPTAWDSLNELTHLVQTYPGWTCLVEGFSHRRAAADQDLDLSSSWAWRVYSALVKSGVNAKRIDVRGHGREAGTSSSDKNFNGIVVTLTKPTPPAP